MNILYEDRNFLVVEKPVGVLSQKGEGSEVDMLSLLEAYLTEKGERATVYVIHRLDQMVGGAMVYAKNLPTASYLSSEIQENRLQKEYLAVVEGDLAATHGVSGEMTDLLFKDSAKNKSFVVKTPRKGVKEARLAYTVLSSAQWEGTPLTLVRVRLFTGRTHQIRVQFSSRGHSLVGDGKYGSRIKREAICLFSEKIGFTHPYKKIPLTFSLGKPKGGIWDLFDLT